MYKQVTNFADKTGLEDVGCHTYHNKRIHDKEVLLEEF